MCTPRCFPWPDFLDILGYSTISSHGWLNRLCVSRPQNGSERYARRGCGNERRVRPPWLREERRIALPSSRGRAQARTRGYACRDGQPGGAAVAPSVRLSSYCTIFFCFVSLLPLCFGCSNHRRWFASKYRSLRRALCFAFEVTEVRWFRRGACVNSTW